ncbi:MAG TPA: glycosyltransferase 87 family protein [Nocardioidaceae bacterium]|nr:glycosyltransferase 87 family protein [Nocardioidaceae bacterium]
MTERPRQGLLRLGAVVALAWLVSRAFVLWLLLDRHAWVRGDVDYFAGSLAAVPDAGLAHTLVEYPLPGVVVVALPWLLVRALGAPETYGAAVIAFSMVADAAFTVLLTCLAGSRRWGAVTVWLLAVPLLGATTYARFDLVPGLLAGVALLLLARRPGLAGGAAALAAGFKLWPALVLPATAAPVATRRRVVSVVTVTGALMAAATVAIGGWQRLFSPLTWQAERGLQIESVAATPAMVGWALLPGRYVIELTEHHAFEITGPGADALLLASGLASALLVPLLLGLWLMMLRGDPDLETVVWAALAAVAAFMVTGKVLSPQYMLWLLPMAAAANAVVESRTLRWWTAALLLATAATQVVFPELYGEITLSGDKAGWAVLALTLRNALLVALTAAASWLAVRRVSAAPRTNAPGPARTEKALTSRGSEASGAGGPASG